MSQAEDWRPPADDAATAAAAPTELFAAGATAADRQIAIGTTIGKYEVRRVVGMSGAGVVLAARDEELGREVAIKFLTRDSDDARVRLLREAKAMAQLSHPNVVAVYEVLRLDDRTGIVMALVDGRDLGEWCSSVRTWREIVAAYVQAAHGLAAAHRAGLVHRDFKPSNALIDARGIVRVTDFGLVRAADEASGQPAGVREVFDDRDLTRTGVVVGTPAYMAPEQHADGTVDARTDQWALACSLHGARPKLEAASRADPEFPLAHLALAQVLDALGDHDAAVAQARAALDHADRLPPRESHVVKARYFETAREWAKAIDEYRVLVHDFPDELDHGLGLANALAQGGSVDAAFATLDRLRTLPPPGGTDPRIDLAAARAADAKSDFHRQQAAAAAAAHRGVETGARLLVANARLDESWASRRLGEHDRADRTLAEARAVFEQLDYRSGIGRARGHLATALLDRGDLAGARREAEAALALFVALGDHDNEATEQSTLGEVLQGLGDLAGAHDSYARVLAIARAANSKILQATTLLNLGLVALHGGDAAEARADIEQALPMIRAVGNRYAEGIAVAALGDVARIEGDLASARAYLADGFATLRTAGDRQDAASGQLDSAGIARITGDLVGARKLIDEVRRESTELQLDALLAGSDLELARVAADEGKLGDAARDARAAIERYHKSGSTDLEARARAFLAIALAADNRATDAAPELERATALSNASQDRLLRIEVALAAARVEAARGNVAGAVSQLRAISGAPDTPIEPRLEARLAEARLAGSPDALARVAHDAAKTGFATIADAARRRRR